MRSSPTHRVACYREGSGPRGVVLLHGFLGSGRNLATLARRWRDRDPGVSLLVPDLTGHGASPPLPEGADLETLAADVLATAAAVGLPQPWRIAGHSLGGRVALRALSLDSALEAVIALDVSPGRLTGLSTGAVLARLRVPAPLRDERGRVPCQRELVTGCTAHDSRSAGARAHAKAFASAQASGRRRVQELTRRPLASLHPRRLDCDERWAGVGEVRTRADGRSGRAADADSGVPRAPGGARRRRSAGRVAVRKDAPGGRVAQARAGARRRARHRAAHRAGRAGRHDPRRRSFPPRGPAGGGRESDAACSSSWSRTITITRSLGRSAKTGVTEHGASHEVDQFPHSLIVSGRVPERHRHLVRRRQSALRRPALR
jgi:hypothetical protein